MKVDIWIQNILNDLNFNKLSSFISNDASNSMKKQLNNINEVNTNKSLNIKSNGGSFIAISSDNKEQKLQVNVDGTLSNSLGDIGLYASSSPNLKAMPYINLLNTLHIGYVKNLHNTFTGSLKDKMYSKVPTEFFNLNKDNKMSMILSLGDYDKMVAQVGIKNNQGFVSGINYLVSDDDMINMQYDNGFSMYANLFGLYVTILSSVKFGINLGRFLPKLSHNNLSIGDIIIGYGSSGVFITMLLNVFIDILGLYLVIEILHEGDLKIRMRLHQQSSSIQEIQTDTLINRLSYGQ